MIALSNVMKRTLKCKYWEIYKKKHLGHKHFNFIQFSVITKFQLCTNLILIINFKMIYNRPVLPQTVFKERTTDLLLKLMNFIKVLGKYGFLSENGKGMSIVLSLSHKRHR